jgi:hypothetical protein
VTFQPRRANVAYGKNFGLRQEFWMRFYQPVPGSRIDSAVLEPEVLAALGLWKDLSWFLSELSSSYI